MIALNVLLSN